MSALDLGENLSKEKSTTDLNIKSTQILVFTIHIIAPRSYQAFNSLSPDRKD